MRRLIAFVPFLALVLMPVGCRHKPKGPVAAEDEGQLGNIVNIADPRAVVQLTRGFYGIENDAWRWTAKNFTVMLRRPPGAEQNGARLELKFTVPDVVLNSVGPLTLTAKVNGVSLPPETFSTSSGSTYARDVPASALSREIVMVEFSADKALAPGAPPSHDTRELAVIVSKVGLLPK